MFMPTHRSLRMAEAIREVVATAILFDIADPRVRQVTVVRVEVTGDLRFATVFVSIMGSESERSARCKVSTTLPAFFKPAWPHGCKPGSPRS